MGINDRLHTTAHSSKWRTWSGNIISINKGQGNSAIFSASCLMRIGFQEKPIPKQKFYLLFTVIPLWARLLNIKMYNTISIANQRTHRFPYTWYLHSLEVLNGMSRLIHITVSTSNFISSRNFAELLYLFFIEVVLCMWPLLLQEESQESIRLPSI